MCLRSREGCLEVMFLDVLFPVVIDHNHIIASCAVMGFINDTHWWRVQQYLWLGVCVQDMGYQPLNASLVHMLQRYTPNHFKN